jgi:cobyrinic acid a,c-diamide synthase
MIYLSQQLKITDGSSHEMAGVLPFSIEMTSRLAKFGYVTVELSRDCQLGERGLVVRGHSFHYSRIVDAPSMPTSYSVSYSRSGKREDEGFSFDNVLASYIHLHFRGAPQIARRFVEFAKSCRPVAEDQAVYDRRTPEKVKDPAKS